MAYISGNHTQFLAALYWMNGKCPPVFASANFANPLPAFLTAPAHRQNHPAQNIQPLFRPADAVPHALPGVSFSSGKRPAGRQAVDTKSLTGVFELAAGQSVKDFLDEHPSLREVYLGFKPELGGSILVDAMHATHSPPECDFKIVKNANGTCDVFFADPEGEGDLWKPLNPLKWELDDPHLEYTLTDDLAQNFFDMRELISPEVPEAFYDTLRRLFEIQKYIGENNCSAIFAELVQLDTQTDEGLFQSLWVNEQHFESVHDFTLRLSEIMAVEKFQLKFYRNGRIQAKLVTESQPNPRDFPVKMIRASCGDYRIYFHDGRGWVHFMEHYVNEEPENESERSMLALVKSVFSDEKGSFFDTTVGQKLWKSIYDDMSVADEDEDEDKVEDDFSAEPEETGSDFIEPVQKILDQMASDELLSDRLPQVVTSYIAYLCDEHVFYDIELPEGKFFSGIENARQRLFDSFNKKQRDRLEKLPEYGYWHVMEAQKLILIEIVNNMLKPVLARTMGWPLPACLEYFSTLLKGTTLNEFVEEDAFEAVFEFAGKHAKDENLSPSTLGELVDLLRQNHLLSTP